VRWPTHPGTKGSSLLGGEPDVRIRTPRPPEIEYLLCGGDILAIDVLMMKPKRSPTSIPEELGASVDMSSPDVSRRKVSASEDSEPGKH
jgi:hypothetical protein